MKCEHCGHLRHDYEDPEPYCELGMDVLVRLCNCLHCQISDLVEVEDVGSTKEHNVLGR